MEFGAGVVDVAGAAAGLLEAGDGVDPAEQPTMLPVTSRVHINAEGLPMDRKVHGDRPEIGDHLAPQPPPAYRPQICRMA